MNTDGWVTIGFKGDKKQLEKDIKDAEKELQDFDKSAEENTIIEIRAKIDKAEKKVSKLNKELQELEDKARQPFTLDTGVKISGGWNLTDEESERYNVLIDKINQVDEAKQKLREQEASIIQSLQQEEVAQQQIENSTTKTKDNVMVLSNGLRVVPKTTTTVKDDVEEIKNGVNGINFNMTKVAKTAVKWALAVIGVRSAYNFIKSSISTLSQYDTQIATDIEYMRYVLAMTLKPVVEWIVNALYTVLGLISTIVYTLTGFNILANASADAFKRMKKGAGGTAGAIKEMKKQLAGFDEMNVLQDNASSGGAGGGGGVGGIDIDEWVPPDAMKKSKEFIDNWFKWGKEMKDLIDKILFNATIEDWLTALGNGGVMLFGIVRQIYGLWEVITGLFQMVKGVFEVIVGLFKSDKSLIMRGIYDILDGFWKVIDGIINAASGLFFFILGAFSALVINLLNALGGLLSGVGDAIGDFLYFIWQGMYKAGETVTQFFVDVGNWLGDRLTDFIYWVVGKFNEGLNFIKSIPDKIKNWFNSLASWFQNLFNRIIGFFKNFGTNAGNAIGGAFKGVINAVIGQIERILNSPINAINGLIGTINNIPGVNIGRLSTFRLPRLAKGGIINQPGRGVMVGSAIAGERGAEGVIPLTDSQQMALLGEAIGKYITVNASITNTMNGRVISRELKQIQNENDFAFNR